MQIGCSVCRGGVCIDYLTSTVGPDIYEIFSFSLEFMNFILTCLYVSFSH